VEKDGHEITQAVQIGNTMTSLKLTLPR
jgi:hypothetical protein